MSGDAGISPSMLDEFLAAVVRLAGARAGIVRARTTDADQSHLVAGYGLPKAILLHETSIVGPCGICGEVLSGKSVRVADRAATGGQIVRSAPHADSCPATVAVALDYKGCSVGVLALFFEDANSLSDEFLLLLRPVGQLLAFALEKVSFECGNLTAHLVDGSDATAWDMYDSVAQSLTFIRGRVPLLKQAMLYEDPESALTHYRNVTHELGKIKRELRDGFLDSGVRQAHIINEMEPIEGSKGAVCGNLVNEPASTAECRRMLADDEQRTDTRNKSQITPREREVLEYVALGLGNKAIAKTLGISHETVKLHVRHIRAKLGFSTRLEAALFVIKRPDQ